MSRLYNAKDEISLSDIITNNETRLQTLFSSTKNIIIILSIVIYLGVYVGQLLFGEDSLEVLLNLQDNEQQLLSEVERLQKDNAKLQKTYFELVELEPDD